MNSVREVGSGFWHAVSTFVILLGYALSLLFFWGCLLGAINDKSKKDIRFRKSFVFTWPVINFVWPVVGTLAVWAPMLSPYSSSISVVAGLFILIFIFFLAYSIGASLGVPEPSLAYKVSPKFMGLNSLWVWIGIVLTALLIRPVWLGDLPLTSFLLFPTGEKASMPDLEQIIERFKDMVIGLMDSNSKK